MDQDPQLQQFLTRLADPSFLATKTEFYNAQQEAVYRAQLIHFTQLYQAYYKVQPLPQMTILEDKVDDARMRSKRNYAFITLNPKDGDNWRAIYQFTKDKLQSRSWIDTILISALEQGDNGRWHTHSVVKLKSNRTPFQIIDSFHGSQQAKLMFDRNGIDVKKISRNDLSQTIKYCKKQENIIFEDNNQHALQSKASSSSSSQT